jgi:hypothetical protein
MNFIDQEIVLETDVPYGEAVPLAVSAPLFRRLADTTRPCVRMAIEGTSSPAGAPPAWLERASEIRTLGFTATGDGYSILHVRAPRLGEAAPEIFAQSTLWPGLASPEDTALQVLSKVSGAIRRKDTGNDFYDPSLLRHFSHWRHVFEHQLRGIRLPDPASHDGSTLDAEVPQNARQLGNDTPPPRQVRVVGKLDMVRHSTRSFGLVLESGQEVRGVLLSGEPEILQQYFAKEITVLGKAIYRPFGSLLRIDAQEILDTTEGKPAFSSVPSALARRIRSEKKIQSSNSGVAAFFGKWPGDETDEELLAALEELRH